MRLDLGLEDEIIIPLTYIRIIIDYPLSNIVILEATSDQLSGFSRGYLVKIITDKYKEIYEEEMIAFFKNDKLIYGPYGIWGYDLNELYLTSIFPIKDNLFGIKIYPNNSNN